MVDFYKKILYYKTVIYTLPLSPLVNITNLLARTSRDYPLLISLEYRNRSIHYSVHYRSTCDFVIIGIVLSLETEMILRCNNHLNRVMRPHNVILHPDCWRFRTNCYFAYRMCGVIQRVIAATKWITNQEP